ncbi:type IV secretory system conjugative DNA transfer family protein [Streptomyces hygroscopicus]|uniref:type IV secretory system conjugative DNA transfer family protein n=1 Tax=Streptomyces hygroscopicus TaxID=1912 RepID=UPI00363401BE
MSGASPSPRAGSDSLLAPALLLAAIGAAASTLVTAPAATALAGRGWASSSRDPGTAALLTLARGPAAAWDPAPPTWLFWAVTVLVWAVLAWAGWRLWQVFGGGIKLGGAQWGGARIERKLAVPADPANRRNRITAGRGQRTKKIVAAKPNISATVFGVPGSSKTSGLVLGNAGEWQGPLLVTTTKAADLDVIYARRKQLGPVWVIAPAGIPGRTTHHWSPVDYCTDAKAADRMAAWMAEASASSADKRSAPWVDQARSILKGVLLAAQLNGGGVNDLRNWLSLGKDAVDHVRGVLLAHGYEEVADDYASPWLRLHDDGVGSIQFTLNVLARVYADEEVRESAAGTDFTVEEMLDQNGTVCLIASESDAERFAPLLTSITASIIHGAEMRYNATGKPLDPSLGVLVDEAGNMLRYPRLPNILTTGRGMGIDLLTVWHDLSQLRETLGTQKANTVMSASGLRMLLPGCADPETLKYFQTLLGRTQVARTSVGRSRGEYSSNTSPADDDLAPVHTLMQLPDFTAIAQYTNLPPIKINMRLTWRDKDLKKYLDAPAPDAISLHKPSTGPVEGADA